MHLPGQLRLVVTLEASSVWDIVEDRLHQSAVPGGAAVQRGNRLTLLILDRTETCIAPYRSEEHTSELQSLMRISYAVFCLKKKTNKRNTTQPTQIQQNKHT